MIENYLSLLLDALVAYLTNYLVSTKFILIEIVTAFVSILNEKHIINTSVRRHTKPIKKTHNNNNNNNNK